MDYAGKKMMYSRHSWVRRYVVGAPDRERGQLPVLWLAQSGRSLERFRPDLARARVFPLRENWPGFSSRPRLFLLSSSASDNTSHCTDAGALLYYPRKRRNFPSPPQKRLLSPRHSGSNGSGGTRQARGFARCLPRDHHRGHDSGQRSRIMATHLPASRTCGMERLDSHRPGLPVFCSSPAFP